MCRAAAAPAITRTAGAIASPTTTAPRCGTAATATARITAACITAATTPGTTATARTGSGQPGLPGQTVPTRRETPVGHRRGLPFSNATADGLALRPAETV